MTERDGSVGTGRPDAGCAVACRADQFCRDGRCAPRCLAPEIECSGICTDTSSDDANCGTCGRACADLEQCVAGACTCPAPFAICDGACRDISTDPGHCGGCGTPCAGGGQTCRDGACGCSNASSTYCSDQCLDCPSGSTSHCGANGPSLCCGSPRNVACDVPGYGTGCWDEGVDCSTLQLCGGRWSACYAGWTPHCDATGGFVCCGGMYPRYCDPSRPRYPGESCWPDDVDCSTIATCPDGRVLACPAGYRVDCATDLCV